ncbi:hypothetical protein FJ659_16925 [Bacillus dicomae]|uniref:Uncharacterized protein n=1 Tax=Bacillus dicomae TaxID=3088378 RepID=A0AC61T8A1_9BACI|nr:hypothetical protein FJ659_16925 [Bacillus dicomae]
MTTYFLNLYCNFKLYSSINQMLSLGLINHFLYECLHSIMLTNFKCTSKYILLISCLQVLLWIIFSLIKSTHFKVL